MKDKIKINELGIKYTVLNRETGRVVEIRVIDSNVLYDLTEELVELCIADKKIVKEFLKQLGGLYKSPYLISWYTSVESRYRVEDAVIQARNEGNSVVVIEVIPEGQADQGYNTR